MRDIRTGETEHPMREHFAWFAREMFLQIVPRLEERVAANLRTAAAHSDPMVKEHARARADAYRTAVGDVMAELQDPRVIQRLSLVWWIQRWQQKR